MFCKTIILSNSENLTTNAPKGILTLSKDNNMIKGKIRLYNLISLPQSTKIGLYVNDNVHISPLIRKTNHYEFDLNQNIDITQSIYCALIDNNDNKKVILEGGSFNGFCFTDSPFDAVLEAKDEQLEQRINTALVQSNDCANCNCAKCEYKNYFYEHYSSKDDNTYLPNQNNYKNDNCCNDETSFNPPIESNTPKYKSIDSVQSNIIDKLNNDIFENFNDIMTEELNLNNDLKIQQTFEQDLNLNTKTTSDNNNSVNQDESVKQKLEFLNEIIYQLDDMFQRYPQDDVLNSIIPNAKFIKIEGSEPYVLGVIYENQMLKYIAYGVPGTYNSLPPRDLGQHYQWLPLNPHDVMSDGYFMIYQDATTGTIVEINFKE